MPVERGWRWANVPIPEPHVGGLVAAILLQLLRPWSLPIDGPVLVALGVGLVAAGLCLVVWAVRAVGPDRLDTGASLVTSGPYRHARHPMYLGWTLVYVGVAPATGLAWPLALLPVVVAWTHLVVRREERRLEERFGEAYRAHRREVRRYL